MFESRYAHHDTGSDVSHAVSHSGRKEHRMSVSDQANFTRLAAALVAENDAREFMADIERLVELLDTSARPIPEQRRPVRS